MMMVADDEEEEGEKEEEGENEVTWEDSTVAQCWPGRFLAEGEDYIIYIKNRGVELNRTKSSDDMPRSLEM